MRRAFGANDGFRMTRLHSATARQASDRFSSGDRSSLKSGLCSPFGIRHSSFRGEAAFTLIELLIVMSIIIILAGLTISTIGYVQDKGRRSRAEAEIAAMSAALESYKADNGIYPRNADTDRLDPTSSVDPTSNAYSAASLYLYEQLSGDTNNDRTPEAKSYFPFKPNQLGPIDQTKNVTAILDPFQKSYGYSTMKAADPANKGYNPTFDLWSTAGGTKPADMPKWIKNW
jgi:type II secretory pathway pseudopilin PulG